MNKQKPSEWIEDKINEMLPIHWTDEDVKEARVKAIIFYLDEHEKK